MCSQMLYLCVLEPLLRAYKVKKVEAASLELDLQTGVNHRVYAESSILLVWQSSKSQNTEISLQNLAIIFSVIHYITLLKPHQSFSKYIYIPLLFLSKFFPPPNHGRQSVIQRAVQHYKVPIAYSIPKSTQITVDHSNGISNYLFGITNSKDAFHFENDNEYLMLQQDFSKKTVLSKKEEFLCLHVSFLDQ